MSTYTPFLYTLEPIPERQFAPVNNEKYFVPCPKCGYNHGTFIRVDFNHSFIRCPKCKYRTPIGRGWDHLTGLWRIGLDAK
jgi:hypothetical protein